MKKMCLSFLLLIPIITIAQTKNFTIEGKIGNWDSPASITLNYSQDGKPVTLSSDINKGAFKFKGQVSYPTKGYLTMHYQGPGKMGTAFMLWIEPGNLTIISPDSLQKIAIKGSILNTEDADLSAIKKSINQQLKQWFAENGRPENDSSEEYKVRYDKKIAEINQANKKATINFIKAHPNSFLSLSEINISLSRGVPDVAVVEPLFNSLSAAIKNSPMGKAYQEKLKGWKTVDIGSIAPDFTQPDQTRKPIKLSDFTGKYVLLDFWASWCHPCREENPNLIKQYNLYKDKGFEILGVSLDEGSIEAKNAWLKAIKADSIGIWTQVSDLKGSKQNEAVNKFGVGSIPESFLIDPTGKIIAKSLRGDLLNIKLKEVFSGKPILQSAGNVTVPYELLNKKLALDTAVRYGKLPNGFTYYIRKNTQPKDRVLFYLVNKAGSILENDEQQGLAHFLEHMNFNGTTHFPKNELVNYLQKAGVRFGADINAYTSFDETVYQLPLPSDKPGVLDSGILIMRDWAQGATLETEEIEKERGVILEEKRIGKGAGERMQRQYLPVLLNQSRYAERLPIGTDEVLNKFKPETLHSFYTNWYRPNLQALIVVGDIDVDQMEQAIKEKFADLKNPVNEQERFDYTVPLTGRNQFVIATDNEQQGIAVQITFKHRAATLQTGDDFRNYIIQNLFNSMITDRIKELTSNKSKPPFITGGAGIGSFIGKLDNYSLSFRAKPGEIETGFKALWQENERVKRYGFTETELNRTKQAFLNRLESGVAELPSTYSQKFVNEYLEHFLKGTAQAGIKNELQLAKTFAQGITLADFKFMVKEYIKDVDRDVLITGPEKEKQTLP
ncbi:MAG: insulinase family protein, partial [Ferruginibacter sp.]|nr:insulinase family protein [Ferruginibacter sp.]